MNLNHRVRPWDGDDNCRALGNISNTDNLIQTPRYSRYAFITAQCNMIRPCYETKHNVKFPCVFTTKVTKGRNNCSQCTVLLPSENDKGSMNKDEWINPLLWPWTTFRWCNRSAYQYSDSLWLETQNNTGLIIIIHFKTKYWVHVCLVQPQWNWCTQLLNLK